MKKHICALIAAGLLLAGCENEAPAPAPTYNGGGSVQDGPPQQDNPTVEQVAE